MPRRTWIAHAVIVFAALIAVLAQSSDAQARAKTLRPVKATSKAATFARSGAATSKIRSGSVLLRVPGKDPKVRLSAAKARRVAGGPLKIRFNRSQRKHLKHGVSPPKARLVLSLKGGPSAGSAGSSSTACDGPFSADRQPGACWRPYSDASPFNRPVDRGHDVGNSQAMVDRIEGFDPSSQGPRISGGVSGTEDDWSHPIYFSQPSDPVYTVHCVEDWGRCEVEGAKIRIPARAKPAAGGDGHMAVIDQSSGTEYDFWQVRHKPSDGGTITVSWGGSTTTDQGADDGRNSYATAAGFGLAAGMIRGAELQAGEINHALFMTVTCSNGKAVYPASEGAKGRVCSDIGKSDRNAPALGQHFYLDMSDAQIDDLSVSSWQKTILRAMAHYGMYVGDTGGGESWGLMAESGSSYTSFGLQDPMVTAGKKAGVPTWDAPTGARHYIFDVRGVNWDKHLRVADPA